MLNWLFGKRNDASGPKDYSPLTPRVASTLRDVLDTEGPAELLTPYFAVILRRDFSLGWRGGTDPCQPCKDALAFVHLCECPHHRHLQQSFELGRQVGGPDGRIMVKQSLDAIARELAPMLKNRADAPEITL